MKRLRISIFAIGLTLVMQGCAIYSYPYGYYSSGYFGYAPYYRYGLSYWPYSYYNYYSYPPYYYYHKHGHYKKYPNYGKDWPSRYGWGGLSLRDRYKGGRSEGTGRLGEIPGGRSLRGGWPAERPGWGGRSGLGGGAELGGRSGLGGSPGMGGRSGFGGGAGLSGRPGLGGGFGGGRSGMGGSGRR